MKHLPQPGCTAPSATRRFIDQSLKPAGNVMFNPSRDQVRHFFCSTWQKYQSHTPLSGLEPLAVDVILQHPEYHTFLQQEEAALAAEFSPEQGQTNPFLHLSLHLAIEEQLSIDQPAGIRGAYERLAAQWDPHAAKHRILDCLGETLWRAQRDHAPMDGAAYLECISRQQR